MDGLIRRCRMSTKRTPLFATYLIQNTLWSIEYAGIDGIRMDTYTYPDKNFMSRWVEEVLNEYPQFNIVGEVWFENNIAKTAYWQRGSKNKDGYQSTLPSVTDFPLCFTVPKALNEPAGFDTGLRKLYNTLCQDFIYPDPNNNLIFLDNHDMTRFFLSVRRDIRKLKMGLAFLLTTRGIPELYYGTELLMDGDGAYHPNIRKDFPGGWPGDNANGFTAARRTAEQNEVLWGTSKNFWIGESHRPQFTMGSSCIIFRRTMSMLYFRYDAKNCVMVVLNANDSEKTLNTTPFLKSLKSFTKGPRSLRTRYGNRFDLKNFAMDGAHSGVGMTKQ